MNRDELIEKAAKALFGVEQCDKRQMIDLDGNWEARLSDKDQEDYLDLAKAVLPLIEADVRERIATEIEARLSKVSHLLTSNGREGYYEALRALLNGTDKDNE